MTQPPPQICQSHPPMTTTASATIHGHASGTHGSRKAKQELHQAKTYPSSDVQCSNEDSFLLAPLDGAQIHHCYAAMLKPSGQIYTVQTGKFVAPSSIGNSYILILYNYDSNTILAVPFKNMNSKCILQAYKLGHARLCATRYGPNSNALTTKQESHTLQEHIMVEGINYQLALSNLHCCNTTKGPYALFKNHFIASLCSTDKNFPVHLWDWLLPQAELSLNLLQGSLINPNLSAWAQLHGQLDFNHTPIVPPGMQVLVHEKPNAQCTWAPHGLASWYLGPVLRLYQCYTVWITETWAQWICDMLTWLPTKAPMSMASSIDLLLAGITDVTTTLQSPLANSPLAPHSNSQSVALQQLMSNLHGTFKPKVPPAPISLATAVPSLTACCPSRPHTTCCTCEGDQCHPTWQGGQYQGNPTASNSPTLDLR